MSRDGSFKTQDGLNIYYRLWSVENPKAIIIIVHGVGEHSARHNDAAIFFNNAGLNVYSADLRGHGKSNGQKGHINSFEEYLTDLASFIDIVKQEDKTRPLFLLGQSLGGLIALYFVLRAKSNVSGVIACAPALEIILPIPSWKKSVARLLSNVFPQFTMKDDILSSDCLSHDKAVCEAYDKDPLVHRYRSVRFYTELLRAGQYVRLQARTIDIPVILLQGTDDMIVSKAATEDFFERLKSANKQLKLYEGFYHEPMHEIGKEKVLSDIIKWCDLLLPPMTSAAQTA